MHIVLGFFCPLSHRPDQVAEKVAARICENFSEAAIVMVGRWMVEGAVDKCVFGSSAAQTSFYILTVILRWITADYQLAALSQ